MELVIGLHHRTTNTVVHGSGASDTRFQRNQIRQRNIWQRAIPPNYGIKIKFAEISWETVSSVGFRFRDVWDLIEHFLCPLLWLVDYTTCAMLSSVY